MPANRKEIVQEALTWIDVPWRHQGRSREVGVDCAGLIIAVAHSLCLSDFDIKNYRREPNRDEFVKHFRTNMQEKLITDKQPGDVLLIRDRMFTCHAAIVVDNNEMVHAFATRRKVVKEVVTAEWLNRATQCFAYPGIEN